MSLWMSPRRAPDGSDVRSPSSTGCKAGSFASDKGCKAEAVARPPLCETCWPPLPEPTLKLKITLDMGVAGEGRDDSECRIKLRLPSGTEKMRAPELD